MNIEELKEFIESQIKELDSKIAKIAVAIETDPETSSTKQELRKGLLHDAATSRTAYQRVLDKINGKNEEREDEI